MFQGGSSGSLEPAHDVLVQSMLGCSNVLVCLAVDPIYRREYAMKIFPYKDGKLDQMYLNETRFMHLSHANIISYRGRKDERKFKFRSKEVVGSYLLMEYACFGDFETILNQYDIFKDEKLVRTYFHQLIEGLEYLHSQGVAHLDLKIENLLMGSDFTLKIADFDRSFKNGDEDQLGKGTINFRAPEVINKDCTDPFAADIYSAGICLFVMMNGHLPYHESLHPYTRAFELLKKSDPSFWSVEHNVEASSNTDESFKKLIFLMTKADPIERATIEEIKTSEWYNKPVYSHNDIKLKLTGKIRPVTPQRI